MASLLQRPLLPTMALIQRPSTTLARYAVQSSMQRQAQALRTPQNSPRRAMSMTTTMTSCACRMVVAGRPLARRPLLAQTQRRYASARKRSSAEPAPSFAMNKMASNMGSALISIRVPQVFVMPPWKPLLRNDPKTLAKLLYIGALQKVKDFIAGLSLKLQSKPSFLTKASYQPRLDELLPVAESMHVQMLEAVAENDTRTLQRLLTAQHFQDVQGVLARRPRGRRCSWRLVEYHGKPRVVDHKVVLLPAPMSTYVRQAVVQIRSRQQFGWWTAADSSGRPRSADDIKEVDKDVVENVIFVATLDKSTWKTAGWRIFGFMPTTTLETWESEKKLLEDMGKLSQ